MNVTAQDEIGSYVEEVRQALGGLPAATREELLEDLPEHLAEVLAEGGGTLVSRLGPPSAYAAELLASTGYTEAPVSRPAGLRGQARDLRDRAREVTRRADVRLGPLLGYAKASEFLVLLRPAWWVLRGYLFAMLLAHMLDDNSGPIGLLPRVGDNELVALLLLAGAVLGSVWVGRRGEPAKRVPRLLLRGSALLLALFALAGFQHADERSREAQFEAGYVSEYSNVQDVFVYDGQGNLVRGAQLYDQWGAPIRFGEPGCVDPVTGDWSASRSLGYPYCPELAPFRGGRPDPAPSWVDGDPSGEAGPGDAGLSGEAGSGDAASSEEARPGDAGLSGEAGPGDAGPSEGAAPGDAGSSGGVRSTGNARPAPSPSEPGPSPSASSAPVPGPSVANASPGRR